MKSNDGKRSFPNGFPNAAQSAEKKKRQGKTEVVVTEVTYHVSQSEVQPTVTNSKFKTTADFKGLEGNLK